MNHSLNCLTRTSLRALYFPTCLTAFVACSEAASPGPEGSTSDTSTSSVSSSSTLTASSSATTVATSTSVSSGSSSQAGSSMGASGQSNNSTGASGQTGTSSGASSQSGTSSDSSGQSGTSSAGSSASTSVSSGGSDSATSDSGGDDSNGGSDSIGGSGSTSGEGGDEFTLTSSAHVDGAEFGDAYTCEGKAFSASIIPPLAWSAGPAGTLSYAITFIDTKIQGDDPNDSRAYHWAMWNIPVETRSIEEGMTMATAPAVQTGKFLGPCPGGASDTYAMTIYAIPTETLDFSGSGTGAVKMADDKMKEVAIGTAVLTGTSSAMSSGGF